MKLKKLGEFSLRMTESPTDPAVIRQTRLFYELSQAQAARLVHVSTQTWSQWERGLRTMHPAFLELFRIKANMVDK